MTTLSHEPIAPWIRQLPDVAGDLVDEATALDTCLVWLGPQDETAKIPSAYADAQALVKKIESILLRRREATLCTVAQLWTTDQIETAKRLAKEHNAPKAGVTVAS